MSTPTRPFGPLAGLKVIELSHVMAGPTCGLMLADMGADVIKVEKIPGGDDTRRSVPPSIGGESAAYLMMNRNKRGVALDLKTEGGKRVLRRLLADADVVTENYRRDTMARMGFGYDALKADNPRLIYCSISGFGRTGPYADRGGFDLVAQGMSGLMSMTGEGPGRPPIKIGAPVTDITAGLLACMGILAALNHRHATGRGQMVDTSLFEAGITHTYWQSAIAFATGMAPQPMGSAHPLNAPYQAFQTADGWITVGAANQPNWLRLIEVLGTPELAEDMRFRTNPDRMAHLAELEVELTARFRRHSSAEWLDRLDAAGMPAGPVLDVNQMHEDPQALARAMIVETEHPVAGPVKALGLPVKFSDSPGGSVRPAPLYGQHTREILLEHGFDAGEIDALAAAGAIRAGGTP
ncbi:MAG TPA: CoA transferase [Aliidongia sp.]|uniref:CaiB/BaiF CoA transferase family protein n=1 Tax=Aliidongia sp. TaxID=1914230 RepID=UPI002DDCE894|nr:CoA transferase [Aliidongia sp.]HEV2673623.1 CoA transferase [Aliidongia sp.]